MIIIQDKNDSYCSSGSRWTFGRGPAGIFGGAYPDGEACLSYFEDCPESGKSELRRKVIKCRSYRRAVRVLRWHLMGYKV